MKKQAIHALVSGLDGLFHFDEYYRASASAMAAI